MFQNNNFLDRNEQSQKRNVEKPKFLRSVKYSNTCTSELTKRALIEESNIQTDNPTSSCLRLFELEVDSVLHPSYQKTFYCLPIKSEAGFVYKYDPDIEFNWKIKKQVSSGRQRDVFLVASSKGSSGRQFIIIKKLMCISKPQKLTSYAYKGFLQEVRILSSLQHRGIVHLINYYLSPSDILLAESFYEGGDLYECTKHFYTNFSPEFVGRIFGEIVDAVAFLHNQLLVHRDLKLENILLTRKYEDLKGIKDFQTYHLPLIKISDFEFSKFVDKDSHIVQPESGSPEYAAPEVYLGISHDGFKADCWSLGILLFAMMEGRLPFDAMPPFEDPPDVRIKRYVQRLVRLTYNWIRCKPSEEQEHEGTANSTLYPLDAWIEARDLVQSLLIHRDHRPYSEELLKNSWICNSFKCDL
ncbi:calcium/calmodulin-dependent protein kinase Ppk27 [Schizosaccharomyces osmophilus]|uniref:Calcium/calmodulin-dependent protein kinase Ppk27 n=1 Tax=Schizosaccharomyces osmophilus TaxID=2545709 RepID=A0AAF0AVY3_9SCHI|nr:calcium/calmodulin-dependent protein kinase Ppk27 [Schizosaccharomyces osmophilus]WBW72962.1 calcium/calmodulin-dependent protein kinase Ppk27 [Schizosaccharomyces osmophilus]